MELLDESAERWIDPSGFPGIERQHEFFRMAIHRGPTLWARQLWFLFGMA